METIALKSFSFTPNRPTQLSFWGEMPRVNNVLFAAVSAAFAAAIAAAARQCQLPQCSEQLGLTPQGNLTYVEPTIWGRSGSPGNQQPCFGEIYILCDREDNFNQSTCFFQDHFSGEKWNNNNMTIILTQFLIHF